MAFKLSRWPFRLIGCPDMLGMLDIDRLCPLTVSLSPPVGSYPTNSPLLACACSRTALGRSPICLRRCGHNLLPASQQPLASHSHLGLKASSLPTYHLSFHPSESPPAYRAGSTTCNPLCPLPCDLCGRKCISADGSRPLSPGSRCTSDGCTGPRETCTGRTRLPRCKQDRVSGSGRSQTIYLRSPGVRWTVPSSIKGS
jgi:hypothetical protein